MQTTLHNLQNNIHALEKDVNQSKTDKDTSIIRPSQQCVQ